MKYFLICIRMFVNPTPQIRAIALLLGPDFCSDIIVVETSDHARLQLQLSYNWHFAVKDKEDPAQVPLL